MYPFDRGIFWLIFPFCVNFGSPQMVDIRRLDVEHMTIGEGPHWDERARALYWVDIRGPKIFRYDPAINKTISIKTSEKDPVGFIIPVKDAPDHFIIGEKLSVVKIHWDTKQNKIVKREVLITLPDPKTNRINDGKCDARGRLWFGTMTDGKNIENNVGAFYSYTPKEGLRTQIKNITISNGIAFSKNNEKFYYIDSMTYKVGEYDFNIDGGEISHVKTAFDFKKRGVSGIPDGMTMDVDGNLWVACFGGRQVIKVSPSTGELMDSVKFSKTHQMTSVAFGGDDFSDLYVTSADENNSGDTLKKYPESGSIYKVTGVKAKGSPAASFDMNA